MQNAMGKAGENSNGSFFAGLVAICCLLYLACYSLERKGWGRQKDAGKEHGGWEADQENAAREASRNEIPASLPLLLLFLPVVQNGKIARTRGLPIADASYISPRPFPFMYVGFASLCGRSARCVSGLVAASR